MGGKKKESKDMHPINQAVQKLITMMKDCGIEESPVFLTPDYDLTKCAYEHGVPVQTLFGGRSAVFVSEEPVKATTKASFMINATLKKPAQRAAAAGIVNAVAGFLCVSRKLHACSQDQHVSCRETLSGQIKGKKVFCCGEMPDARKLAGSYLVDNPDDADVILITGDGLIDNNSEIIGQCPIEKLLCLGPSTAGVAYFLGCNHFCPYGRANLQTSEE